MIDYSSPVDIFESDFYFQIYIYVLTMDLDNLFLRNYSRID